MGRRLSSAAIEERIHTQGSQIRELGSQIRDLATETKAAISGLATETRKSLESLSIKFDEQAQGRTSLWVPLIGIGVTALLTSAAMAAGLSFTILTLRVSPLEDKYQSLQTISQRNFDTVATLEANVKKDFDSVRDILRVQSDDFRDKYVSRTEQAGRREDYQRERDRDRSDFFQLRDSLKELSDRVRSDEGSLMDMRARDRAERTNSGR